MSAMFTDMLDEAVEMSDGELDAAIRETELARRRLHARQAALVAPATRRGTYRLDGHRSIGGYLRATCNASNAEVARLRNLADVTSHVPEVGEALVRGHIGVSQVQQLARIHTNPRTRSFLSAVAPIYLDRAEHAALDDLRAATRSLRPRSSSSSSSSSSASPGATSRPGAPSTATRPTPIRSPAPPPSDASTPSSAPSSRPRRPQQGPSGRSTRRCTSSSTVARSTRRSRVGASSSPTATGSISPISTTTRSTP